MTLRPFWNMILDKGQGQKNFYFKKQHGTRFIELFSRRESREEKTDPLDRILVGNISLTLTPGSLGKLLHMVGLSEGVIEL